MGQVSGHEGVIMAAGHSGTGAGYRCASARPVDQIGVLGCPNARCQRR